jgi:hypothetical protein
MKTWTTREKIYGSAIGLALAYFVGYPIGLEHFPCLDPSSFACRAETNAERIREALKRSKF